jgi:hypothetical protein
MDVTGFTALFFYILVVVIVKDKLAVIFGRLLVGWRSLGEFVWFY